MISNKKICYLCGSSVLFIFSCKKGDKTKYNVDSESTSSISEYKDPEIEKYKTQIKELKEENKTNIFLKEEELRKKNEELTKKMKK
jgi:hypothetical protein